MKRKLIALVLLAGFVFGAPFSVANAEETKEPLIVDVFWSMRSPYCYIALDRVLELQKKYNLTMNFRPVYPIAIRDSEFFKGIAKYMYYRIPYQGIDTLRSAEFAGMPYSYPNPDPVIQGPDFGPVKPFEEQVLIQQLTRIGVAAAEKGQGWDYLNQVSRLMWNGMVPDWTKDNHLRDAINRAGLDADKITDEVMNKNPQKYDDMIEANQELQKQNLAGHTGVPLFVFNDEPFFGQDRIDQLVWRLKQYGLTKREE